MADLTPLAKQVILLALLSLIAVGSLTLPSNWIVRPRLVG